MPQEIHIVYEVRYDGAVGHYTRTNLAAFKDTRKALAAMRARIAEGLSKENDLGIENLYLID